MIAAHQAPEIEIPKLKKIKLKLSQDSQIAMDQMDQIKSTALLESRMQALLFNSKAITNTITVTITNIDKTMPQLQVNKETPKVKMIKCKVRELSQPAMEQMDHQESTASQQHHQEALLKGIITLTSFKLLEMIKEKHSHTQDQMALTFQNSQNAQE